MTKRHARFPRRRARLRLLALAAGCLSAPLAAWGLSGELLGAGGTATAGVIDFESAVPARHFINVASTADHVLEARARNRRREEVVEVKRGDTLMRLLQGAGVDRSEAHRAITALKDVYSPRDLKPGQEIQLSLLHDETDLKRDAEPRLAGLSLRASAEEDVKVRRTGEGGFVAEAVERALSRRVAGASGDIEASLYADARREDVPVSVILQMIRSLSYAVDFQRDLQPGDHFEVVYETFTETSGSLAKVGPLLYAAMEVQGEHLKMYRFETDDGDVEYFNPKGESVRRLLMRTPVDGARLSSGYGMRKHPILGYSRMHKGVDFAAPTGTPVYAAGRGRVDYAGRNGGYGNYVRLRHPDGYKTAYAHLNRIADGLSGGDRVKQGEVIGYIGSTGRSTGPHLHYEVLVNGASVNPRALDLPTGRRLQGQELARFQETMADIDRLRQGLPQGTRIAHAACSGKGAGDDGC